MSSVLAIRPSVASFDVDEGSTTDFTVTLNQAPSAELVVRIVPADAASAAAIGISLPELRFEPTNFDQPQSITVTGLVDTDAADALASITLSADGVDPVTVAATVRDHDKVEIATDIAAGNILTVNETKTSTVHVHLTHQPAADVRVKVTLGTGPVTVLPAECTFTAANYDVDQTFTFSAPDDVNTVSEDESLTFQAHWLARQALHHPRRRQGHAQHQCHADLPVGQRRRQRPRSAYAHQAARGEHHGARSPCRAATSRSTTPT